MFSSKYGKCHAGSISATPSAEMNRVETTLAIVGSLPVAGCRQADAMSRGISSESGTADHDDGDVVGRCPALMVDGRGRDLSGDGGRIPVAERAEECRQPSLAEEVAAAPTLDHAVRVEQQCVPRLQGGGRLVQR